jgi:2-polyprenyl-3-methyl-5-hydroxy-6-metoxy-1,4-benzoquinol methylase/methyltransferase-like protein
MAFYSDGRGFLFDGSSRSMTASHSDDDEGLARTLAITGRKYDSIPYTSIPFQRLQPSRMAANAVLLGLRAPEVTTARTLEIGCASGGHIIPLAATFPRAKFVGVDVSTAQIADAHSRADRLRLENITFHARSVTDIDGSWGEFDFIICHGVYSWVPDAVREAIMHVCAERLTPDGIAAISFNVLPGWRVFQAVRDTMVLHAGCEVDHEVRSARTRQMFELMAMHSPETSSYGSIWRNEAGRMAEQPDAYLAHEVFEDDNAPCTFSAFAKAAARHGLAYLAETRVRENMPEAGQAERARIIRQLSGGELLATEQYIDILTGRTFRESLLIHAQRAASADRSLAADRLAQLHLIAPLDLKSVTNADTGEFTLKDGDGNLAVMRDALIADALQCLMERLPRSTSLDDLAPPNAGNPEQCDRVAAALMALVLQGCLDVATAPVECARDATDAPKAWPLVVEDALSGAERSATRRHASFTITPTLRFLLPLLDGERSRVDIAERLFDLARAGYVQIADDKGVVTDLEQLRVVCLATINRQIEILARIGVLVEG